MKKSELKKLIREVIEEKLRENDIPGDEWKDNPEEDAANWKKFYDAIDQGMNPQRALSDLNPIFSKAIYWKLVAAALLQEKEKLRYPGFDDMDVPDTINAIKNFAEKPDLEFLELLNLHPNSNIEGVQANKLPLHFFNHVLQSPGIEGSPRRQQRFKDKFHMLALTAADRYNDELNPDL